MTIGSEFSSNTRYISYYNLIYNCNSKGNTLHCSSTVISMAELWNTGQADYPYLHHFKIWEGQIT